MLNHGEDRTDEGSGQTWQPTNALSTRFLAAWNSTGSNLTEVLTTRRTGSSSGVVMLTASCQSWSLTSVVRVSYLG